MRYVIRKSGSFYTGSGRDGWSYVREAAQQYEFQEAKKQKTLLSKLNTGLEIVVANPTLVFPESLIVDLADALAEQKKFISESDSVNANAWMAQLRDSTTAVATVITRYLPERNLDDFYERAGYDGAHPIEFPFERED